MTPPPRSAEPMQAADLGGEEGDRTNILVVDDLPEKLLVFGTLLEDLGQNLVFVRSGSDALREVLHRDFAVILLDVNMPDIDGFETASLIRRYKRSAHTPIIFITAYADEIQTAKGYSLGAVDYILSPVVPEMLRSKVKVFVQLNLMQRRIKRQAEERVALAAAEAARRVAEENDRRSHFLSHASRILSGSLDVKVGMHLLLDLVVPEIACLAVLVVAEGTSMPEHALVAAARTGGDHGNAVSEKAYGELPEPVQIALQQALQMHRRVSLPLAALPPLGAAAFGLQGPLELRSADVVPLMIGDRALGALLVGSEQAAGGQAARDWAALEELASRAAIAFENANLYRSLQTEIIERRAAQTELQEANQRKDEFLAMLSHELRNPLAPIRNALEVVRRIAPPDPKFTWAGDVMDRQVRHLSRLVEELLDVARISRGKIALNIAPVDLKAVVAHGVEMSEPFTGARSQSLVVTVPSQPVWLHGDFARLAQIVANLLHNAAKYSLEGGTVELQLSVEDAEAVLTIRDHGIGIDAQLLPHIFDLFAQGSRSLDRNQGGLGVGLTLVRRLVELHGGRVEAHSAGVDQGAEFKVCLPGAETGPGPAPALPHASAPAAMSGRRVLVVDDNIDAGESVALFLQLEGHEVKTVVDGNDALAQVEAFAPDVVVLDIGLPVLNGYEVARRLRRLPAMKHALLIALTGYGQKEDRLQAEEAGFDHHLVKPTDPQSLVALIAEWAPRGDSRQAAH